MYNYTLIDEEGKDVLGEPVDERLRDAVYIFTQAKDIKKKYAEVMAFLTSSDSYQSLKYVGENLYQVRISNKENIFADVEKNYIVDGNLNKISEPTDNFWHNAYFSGGASAKNSISEARMYQDPYITSRGKSFGGLICAYPFTYFNFGEIFAGDTHNSGGMINCDGAWTIEPTYSYSKIVKYDENKYLANSNREFSFLGKGGERLKTFPAEADFLEIYRTEESTYFVGHDSESEDANSFIVNEDGKILFSAKDTITVINPNIFAVWFQDKYIDLFSIEDAQFIKRIELKEPISSNFKTTQENASVADLISNDFGANLSEFPYIRNWGDVMDYTEECSFPDCVYPMVSESGKWGYVDENYQWVIEPKYEFVQPFRLGYGLVGTDNSSENSNAVLIDKNGNEVLSIKNGLPAFPSNLLTDNLQKSPKEQYASLLKLLEKHPKIDSIYYAGDNIFGYLINYDSMVGYGHIGYISIDFEEIIPLAKDIPMLFFDQGIASIYFHDDDQLYVTNKGYLVTKDQVVDYLGFDNSQSEDLTEQSKGLRKILNIRGFASTPFLLGGYRQLTDTVFYKSFGGLYAEEGTPRLCLVNSRGEKLDCDFNKVETFQTAVFRIGNSVRLIPHSYGGQNPFGDPLVVYDESGNKLFTIDTNEMMSLRYLAPDRWFVYELNNDGAILNARLINEKGETIYHVNM